MAHEHTIIRKIRVLFKVLRKPLCTDTEYSSPRYMRENHYAILVHNFENFSGFHSQEISITLLLNSNMSWKELPQSGYKNSYFVDVLHYREQKL